MIEQLETPSGSRRTEVRRVQTASALADVERLRFDVYCKEKGWLDASRFPDGRERDAFDAASVHFGAYRDGRLVGASRLVLKRSFPLEQHCSLDGAIWNEQGLAEVSRLVVDPAHRRALLRPGDGERLVLLDLFVAMATYSVDHGIRSWLAAMDPLFVRLLSVAGVKFDQVGPLCDYFGPVAPYMARVDRLVGALSAPRGASGARAVAA